MTIKEELEILRGEPIEVFDGDPMDIPCIETSDAEKLCKHPVVSVHMITYNHEPYIRQAIEGVMMQKTDFEFELVIGEDASQDKTREICFEYQKKYPDKIRVLWWHENVTKYGGNGRRVTARCRGEFIALCEGDDYWIDPLKLQKQVEVMRKHNSVNLCFCGSKVYHGKTDTWEIWNENHEGFSPGLIPSRKFMLWTMCGRDPTKWAGSEYFVMTATLMFRHSTLCDAKRKLEIFTWKLGVGDSTICLGMASLGDVFYIGDIVSVYRQMPGGATCSASFARARETIIVRFFFFKLFFNPNLYLMPNWIRRTFCYLLMAEYKPLGGCVQRTYYRALAEKAPKSNIFRHAFNLLPCRLLLRYGACKGLLHRLAVAFSSRCPSRVSSFLKNCYADVSTME